MNALVIGCGRVGSSIARQLAEEGWDVSVVDENEESLVRLGDRWPGRFVVGHGMDVEVLRMLQEVFQPLVVDEESLAYSAHQEVGQGGHFLGAVHTLERFRECFYRPLLSSTENYERWNRLGGRDAATRANEIWKKTLEEYEKPPIDESLEAELKAFVDRRRKELGD